MPLLNPLSLIYIIDIQILGITGDKAALRDHFDNEFIHACLDKRYKVLLLKNYMHVVCLICYIVKELESEILHAKLNSHIKSLAQ